MSLKNLKALNDKIIFKFVQDTAGNMFRETTKSGITVMENKEKQLQAPRWGVVVTVGKDVSAEIYEGLYILVEPLMWTLHLEYDSEKFWVTSEPKVLAVSDTEPTTYR